MLNSSLERAGEVVYSWEDGSVVLFVLRNREKERVKKEGRAMPSGSTTWHGACVAGSPGAEGREDKAEKVMRAKLHQSTAPAEPQNRSKGVSQDEATERCKPTKQH